MRCIDANRRTTMSKLRTTLFTAVSAITLLGAGSAGASTFQVWDNSIADWSNNGVTHFTGPTAVAYLGVAVVCNADLTVTVIAGVATVTAATFTGSTACTGIVPYFLPWSVSTAPYAGPNPPFTGAPVLSPVLSSVIIGGVKLYVPLPANANCPSTAGSISAVLDVSDQTGSPPLAPTPNRLVFKNSLGPCVFYTRTNTAPNSLVANPAVRIL
jgi:hypothetical protein